MSPATGNQIRRSRSLGVIAFSTRLIPANPITPHTNREAAEFH